MSLEQPSLTSASLPTTPVVAGTASSAVDENARLSKVLAITEEMFFTAPTSQAMCDPDDPDHLFVVITVHARGSAQELIQRHVEWGNRVRPLNADLSLRLAIVPVDSM